MKKLRRVKNYLLAKMEKKHLPNEIDYQSALSFFRHREHVYEELITAVQPYINRDGVIFDVGACIGYFSLLLMNRSHFTGSAYLFEPIPNLALLCKRTFAQTPYHVQVFNYGLGDGDGECDIFTARNGNIGWNTLVADKASPDMDKVTVKIRAFDSTGINVTPDFVKVDVEGAEYKVFRGMLGSLRTWKPLPVIVGEIGWGQSHPNWGEELSVFEELEKLGYRFHRLDGSRIEIGDLQQTTDVIMVPQAAQSP